jgi:hypothetical protein
MPMSRGITTTILAGLLLTTCLTTGGCGRRARDYTWYDSGGHKIQENWKVNSDGKRVPDPHPRDRYGRPWVYDSEGNLVPQDPPAGTRRRSGGGLFLWGGSGYRSGSSGTSYRSGGGSSSISRGGFGSTGSGGG